MSGIKPNYMVVTMDGEEIPVVRRFSDILDAQKAYPAVGSKMSYNEQMHHMIAFQCHQALTDQGVIAEGVSLDEWVKTIHDIKELDEYVPRGMVRLLKNSEGKVVDILVDEDDDDDPLETVEQDPSGDS